MAAPKSGPTAKKSPEAWVGHHRLSDKLRDAEIEADEPPPEPPKAPKRWSHAVQLIWNSLLTSPLRHRFEEGDWSFAHYVCNFLDDTEKSGYPSGKMMTARSLMNDLLMTESSRIANNVRITRPPPEDAGKAESLSRARARREHRKADSYQINGAPVPHESQDTKPKKSS